MHAPVLPSRLSATTVIAATCTLALLHVGREILEPVVLATILSQMVAPLAARLGKLGLGRATATMAVLASVTVCVAGIGMVLATQLTSVTEELPRYRSAIEHKAETVRELAARPFARIEAGLKLVQPSAPAEARARPLPGRAAFPPEAETAAARAPDLQTWSSFLQIARHCIEEAFIVLVLMLFILWEHESLQDRLIRLAGRGEISRTIRALADAAQGVSRYFLSQAIVNAGFGAAIGLALAAAGIPHALLWGILSATMRFIPYLGVLAAGGATMIFVAAVDPGWRLTLYCMAIFAALELIISNLVEPRLYGHSTGLSPLAVVMSALFWGTLWGPAGLLISTPVALCLVVAGRHVRALAPLTILLAEAPKVTAAQRFFQRALSGETGAILRDAKAFLQHSSFGRYCDHVLLPGLALAATEWRIGQIDAAQQGHIRTTIAEVAETLAPAAAHGAGRRHHHAALRDVNVGTHLRQLREARLGRWQGSLDVPLHSIVLCAGLAAERDDVISELLARALQQAGIDARSVPLPLPVEEHTRDKAELISAVFIPYPLEEQFEAWTKAVAHLRALLPQALLVTARPAPEELVVGQQAVQAHLDKILLSFEEGLTFLAPGSTAANYGARAPGGSAAI
ncbi:MAG: AI-2E family transporter [Pseudomonadota bacterium]